MRDSEKEKRKFWLFGIYRTDTIETNYSKCLHFMNSKLEATLLRGIKYY